MNFSKSLFLSTGNEKLDNNKLDNMNNSLELKNQKTKLIINSYNNSLYNIISENNENKKNSNKIYNNNNYEEENKLSNDNLNENNIINNNVSSLKIKIPYEIMDNHPIFFVQRIEEKNKNCNDIIL